MNYWRHSAALILLASSYSMAAETFTGAQPMSCQPLAGHDCLPTESTCKQLKGEPGKDLTLRIDVQKMTMRTPYRNDTLPIQAFGNNAESLVLQGTSLGLVWSATIHRSTGRLTMAIADREGAYIIFGQCKVETSKASSSKEMSSEAADA